MIMSPFWSAWVMVLATFNFAFALLLFVWAQYVRIPTQPDGTSGHVWGPLREGMHKLPTWWVWLSAFAFVFGFAYVILYPGFGNFPGKLGWTSAKELARDTAANNARLDPELQRFASGKVEELAHDPAALALGNRSFIDNCAACHGREGRGNPLLGAPNLTDSDWLYGGNGDAILASILNGRHGVMPPWGAVLHDDGVEAVANYVLSLSGAPHDEAKATVGKSKFTFCIACHGPTGHGNPVLGAPNLTDTVWLYGGDLASVETSIRDGRGGVMPAWKQRLSDGEVHAVAGWVYSRSHQEVAAR